MKASVATATRYDSVACDERNFSSSEERALAPLTLVSPRSAAFSPLGLSPQRSMSCRPTRELVLGKTNSRVGLVGNWRSLSKKMFRPFRLRVSVVKSI